MTIITPLLSFKRTRSKSLQCHVCDFLFSNNFWHGHVFVFLFTVKVNFQACGLGSSGFRPKIPHFCSSRFPYLLGSLVTISMAMQGLSWQVNLSGESAHQRRVSTISWSNLTGWLHFPLVFKYFAASSAAARPAPAAAQVILISPWHHYRQRWLVKGLYMYLPVCLPILSFHDLSVSLLLCFVP